MRYESEKDLPMTLRRILPEKAQALYLEGFQRGWDEYDAVKVSMDQSSAAHRQGWALMESEFVLDRATGRYHPKGRAVVEEAPKIGFFGKVRGLFRRAA